MVKNKVKRALAALTFLGVPLIVTASCDPLRGTLGVYRDDDYHDYGFFDWFIADEYFYDDCCYYDDYYYEEIIIYP